MRIWLDPLRMAAHGISASDIQAAIEDNNYQAAPGQIKENSRSAMSMPTRT